jgi:hypothetical protein
MDGWVRCGGILMDLPTEYTKNRNNRRKKNKSEIGELEHT